MRNSTSPRSSTRISRGSLPRRGAMPVFFFQAEDGRRNGRVTGVQTCALPIYFLGRLGLLHAPQLEIPEVGKPEIPHRSEERRVGKSVDLGGRRIIKKKKKMKKQKKTNKNLKKRNNLEKTA